MGTSGSGKTHFIVRAIRLIKEKLNLEAAVIKNIHDHEVDTPGKDSHEFSEAGASYSVIRNRKNENCIFLKQPVPLEDLIDWLSRGPLKIDVLFIEGFRNLAHPSVLCARSPEEIKDQINEHVKMISGLISNEFQENFKSFGVPVIKIEDNFELFVKIFELRPNKEY
ncbi:MAG: molybdopterin-guanine dinucleotide biosynthesis protein MobB [Candidatus Lokiarchaeota archaeon]|nr:molybdopterin-guanine dinucleotide biosynthesis protein MobB [Candidatus Lokiarchaeota archaeon]